MKFWRRRPPPIGPLYVGRYLVVAQEYHKKYMPEGGRAVHYHAILALQAPFARKKLCDYLSQQCSIKAWFSFSLMLGRIIAPPFSCLWHNVNEKNGTLVLPD